MNRNPTALSPSRDTTSLERVSSTESARGTGALVISAALSATQPPFSSRHVLDKLGAAAIKRGMDNEDLQVCPRRFRVSITRADGSFEQYFRVGGSSIDHSTEAVDRAGLGGVVRVLALEPDDAA